MKLMNAIMRPGVVCEVNTDDIIGNIRAYAPGLFSDQESIENLPPIKPLLFSHTNSYTSPSVNSEVWIISFVDNPLQLYWIRRDTETFLEDNSDIINEDGTTDVEIILNKLSGGMWASFYFTDGSGWVLSYGNSFIKISPEGDITLGNGDPHRTISITSDSIGLGGTTHPSVYGDSLVESMIKISTLFRAVSNVASINPYTSPIATAINSKITDFEDSILEITSPNVYLD